MTRRADDAHKFVKRGIDALKGQDVNPSTTMTVAILGLHVLALAADSLSDIAAEIHGVTTELRDVTTAIKRGGGAP